MQICQIVITDSPDGPFLISVQAQLETLKFARQDVF